MKNEDLKILAQMQMPFGKYKDRVLIDLPEPYLLWFEKQGFPKGRLGELLQLATEIHRNGLTQVLEPLKHIRDLKKGQTVCMTPEQIISLVKSTPEAISFGQVIKTIDKYYTYNPARFYNGLGEFRIDNKAGDNVGSCKIFSFAKLHLLNQTQTLACFGKYYRHDVLPKPNNTDHANIRNFMQYGWEGIEFETEALVEKIH